MGAHRTRHHGVVVIAGLVALSSFVSTSSLMASTPRIEVSEWVRDQGVDPARSTLLIQHLDGDGQWFSNAQRADERFPPASTSKIPHTLIAIETGAATTDTVFAWDGVERFAPQWNADQTLASAFRVSAVWVFQTLTSTLGHATMASWIDRFDYGNETIGSPADLTTYWLRGPLATSAHDQIAFLERLVRRELPVSAETYDTALPLMVREQGEGWTLYAKSGWMAAPDTLHIGWFVGWVEVEAPGAEAGQSVTETYLFALNLDMPDSSYRHLREATVRHVLVKAGILPDTAGQR